MIQQHTRFLSFTACSALSVALACAGLGFAGDADARGGGGPHGGGGARTSVNHGGGGNVNRGANVNHNANVNRNVNANVNRNVNVHNNVNVVGGRGGYYDNYHPVATAAAVTAGVAVTAAVVGSVVRTLPPSCTAVVMNGITYQQCGGAYYQPQYVGSEVNYVVVNP